MLLLRFTVLTARTDFFDHNFSFNCKSGAYLSFEIFTDVLLLALVYWLIVTKVFSFKYPVSFALVFAGGLANIVELGVTGCVFDYFGLWGIVFFNTPDLLIDIGVLTILLKNVINSVMSKLIGHENF